MSKHARTDWIASATRTAARFALNASKPFTIEQLRARVASRVEPPAELRWWGAVTLALVASGVIFKTPTTGKAKSSNYALKPLWASKRCLAAQASEV